jgi:hypothetical protein
LRNSIPQGPAVIHYSDGREVHVPGPPGPVGHYDGG